MERSFQLDWQTNWTLLDFGEVFSHRFGSNVRKGRAACRMRSCLCVQYSNARETENIFLISGMRKSENEHEEIWDANSAASKVMHKYAIIYLLLVTSTLMPSSIKHHSLLRIIAATGAKTGSLLSLWVRSEGSSVFVLSVFQFRRIASES